MIYTISLVITNIGACVQEWNKTVQAEQANTKPTEKPKFTVEDVALKLSALDREVKYLINKAKLFRPKPKPKPKDKSGLNKTEASANDTKSAKREHCFCIVICLVLFQYCLSYKFSFYCINYCTVFISVVFCNLLGTIVL